MTVTVDRFRALGAGSRFLLVAKRYEESARALGLLEPGGIEKLFAAHAGPRGRAPTAVVPLAGEPGAALHLRSVRHGGVAAPLLRDWWLSPLRPIAELRATAELESRGAPVPEPVLVAGRRTARLLYRSVLGTRHVPGATDALAFLRAKPERERLLRATSACGHAVRRFHDAGGCHADLHAGNLLVVEERAKTDARVVDLDRAQVLDRVDARRRLRELVRLYRSLEKRELLGVMGPEGAAEFFRAYTRGDRRFAAALLAHLRRERLRTAVHRLAYRSGPRA